MMDFDHSVSEKPLDRNVPDGGYCGIFRTIACIGDSLSSGEHEAVQNDGTSTYHDFFEYSWGQYMARAIGCTVFNMSKGGMTAKEFHAFADEKGYWNPEYTAQAYIIALGVNDVTWGFEGLYGARFGTDADMEPETYDETKPSIVGEYTKIIRKILTVQPKARIFLMTMPFDSNHGPQMNERMDMHVKMLYTLAEKFPFTYVLDLRKYAPDYGTKEFHDAFYMGGHLNAAGYLYTSRLVMSYMDYVIRNHFEDFTQVGFIGKDTHSEAGYKW